MPAFAAQPDLAIDLAHVAKTYKGKVRALTGIEMHVRRGEIFGLLGPNGAGKSTLVKILMTVVRPSKCEGLLLGKPVGHKPTLARVGYLPENPRFPEYLTGAQIIDSYGALAIVPRAERRKRAADLLELVGMTKWARIRVGKYSKGMRQRVGLAQALSNDPDLVMLDEPTDGVDPVGRREIRDLMLEMKRRGKTVFVNSHLLSEAEAVCERVAILVQGAVAKQGTIEELTVGSRRYEIEHTGAPSGSLDGLARSLCATEAPGEGGVRTLSIPGADAERVQPVIDALRGAGATIRAVRPVRQSLEDLFMQAVTDPTTGETLKPGAADAKKKGRR